MSTAITHIVQTPGTLGGRPRIDGTRIAVDLITRLYVHQNTSVDELLEMYPFLTPGQIHAALAFYYDHQEMIEDIIEKEDAYIREALADYEPDLRQYMTVERAARYLGFDDTARIYSLIEQGELEAVKREGEGQTTWLLEREKVAAWRKKRTE